MSQIIVPNTFSSPRDEHFYRLENPHVNSNAFISCVREYNISGLNESKSYDIILDSILSSLVLIEISKLLKSRDEKINLNNLKNQNIKKLDFLNNNEGNFYNKFLENLYFINLEHPNINKIKFKINNDDKKEKGVSLSKNDVTILKIHITKYLKMFQEIYTFFKLIIDNNQIERYEDILRVSNKGAVHNLNINDKFQLYFFVILVLENSLKLNEKKKELTFKKKNIFSKQKTNILYHEIKIALLAIDDNISKYFFNILRKFESDKYEIYDLIKNYTIGIFEPVIKKKIQNKTSTKAIMETFQKDFANKINILINSYKNSIETKKESKANILFNTNTFGAGKTTIGSIITSSCLSSVNSQLIEDQIVGIFILPNINPAVNFASAVSMDQCTWIIQDGRIYPLFKYCPKIRETNGKKVRELTEKWADRKGKDENKPKDENGNLLKEKVPVENKKYYDGLNLEASIFGQFKQILDWTPEWKKTNFPTNTSRKQKKYEYIKGKDHYQKPVMVISDAKSALEILNNSDKFKKEFKIHFLPVIDEYVATADCKISIKNNHYLNSIINIITMNNFFSIMMSASTSVDEIENCKLFLNCQKEFADVSTTTRSFTQLYNNEKKAICPLNVLDYNTFDSIKKWNDTDYRFITPIAFLQMIDIAKINKNIKFELTFDDVINQNKLIKSMKRFFEEVINAEGNEDVINQLCKIEIDYKFPNNNKDTYLTLTSLDLKSKILQTLSTDKISHQKIKDLFKDENQRISNELKELRACSSRRSNNKSDDNPDSKLLLEQNISELEHLLRSKDKHQIKIETKLGSNQISYEWYLQYASHLPEDELAVMLSGQEIDYRDERNIHLEKANPVPRCIIDDITSMFGRNDHKIKNVIIDDPYDILGFDTLKQALARAGRSGKDPIVSGILKNNNLLNLFKSNSISSLNRIDSLISSSILIQKIGRGYIARKN